MLKTQLILKNIITAEDWQELEDHIQYDYLYDNHFSDLKENELLNEQLGVAAAMEPYMGKYFSAYYVRNKILKQTETEIIEMDKQIEKEIEKVFYLTQINQLILQLECQWIQIWTLGHQSMNQI